MADLAIYRIPSLFHGMPEKSVLSIQMQDDDSFAFSLDANGDTEATLGHLKKIIGEDRFRQISLVPEIGLDVSAIDQNTLVLTKNVVRRIFIGLAKVSMQDVKAVMKQEDRKKDAAGLFRSLVPFATFEDFKATMMGDSPEITQFYIDKASTSGKGLKGLTERVWLAMNHFFTVLEDQNAKANFLRDVELLTSRLADREMQEGDVLFLSDGCFYVDKVIASGGAYVSILRDFEEIIPPRIILRGTAMRSNAAQGWLSGANDLLLEIGLMGTKSIWPELSSYLIDNRIDSVEVWGKSLGGAYAQEIAVLIEGIHGIQIDRLVTYCSTGTAKDVHRIFKEEILDKRGTPFKMCVIRNGGEDAKGEVDYIPCIGGAHLGEGTDEKQCEMEFYYIHPKESEEGNFPQNPSFFHLVRQFLNSFHNAHCRQTTLEDFSWSKIDSREEMNLHLRSGLKLEGIRKSFAYAIHVLTLFLFNGRSFSSFFNIQKKLKELENKDLVPNLINF